MSNWKQVSDFVNFTTKGITPKYVENSSIIVLNQKCIRNNRIDYSFSQYTDDTKQIAETKFVELGDILINSTGVGTAGRCAFVSELPLNHRLITDSHILILRCGSYYEAKCLNYLLFSFEKTLMSFMTGSSGQSELDKVVLMNLKTKMPTDSSTQKNIGSFLSKLETKIELNNRINAELEAMAKTLYDYWFVQFDFPNAKGKPYKASGGKMVFNEELKREIPDSNEWSVGTLLDIAEYANGLPCQKFRPTGEEFLRVIKIREMNEGFSANTEFVRTDIPEKAIIKNGDVLFSWSASLEVKIWTGGKGALNQHIFKVTSDKYPKSFYYYQLLNYLQHFKMMAENRKTTMGHITQEHLKQSRIAIPPNELTNKLEEIIAPLFAKKINNEIENQELAELRDWLLPMLMNGQVKVGAIEDKVGLRMAAEPGVKYGK